MEAVATELSVKRIIRFEGTGSLRAFCDLGIGDLVVIKGVRVVDGKNGLFVSMPRQQGKNGKWFDSVEASSKDFKQELSRVVLDAYEQEGQR